MPCVSYNLSVYFSVVIVLALVVKQCQQTRANSAGRYLR